MFLLSFSFFRNSTQHFKQEDYLKKLFDTADYDKKNHLTIDQVKGIFMPTSLDVKSVQQIFDKLDKTKNKINFKEFVKIYNNINTMINEIDYLKPENINPNIQNKEENHELKKSSLSSDNISAELSNITESNDSHMLETPITPIAAIIYRTTNITNNKLEHAELFIADTSSKDSNLFEYTPESSDISDYESNNQDPASDGLCRF